MRALTGLAFILLVVVIFIASMAFGTLAAVATMILIGLETAWRGVVRLARLIRKPKDF